MIPGDKRAFLWAFLERRDQPHAPSHRCRSQGRRLRLWHPFPGCTWVAFGGRHSDDILANGSEALWLFFDSLTLTDARPMQAVLDDPDVASDLAQGTFPMAVPCQADGPVNSRSGPYNICGVRSNICSMAFCGDQSKPIRVIAM